MENHAIPDDQTVWALADVLAYHSRLNPPGGKCSCGYEVPLGARFTEHQVRVVLESEAGQRMLVEREALRATVARVEALNDVEEAILRRHGLVEGDPCRPTLTDVGREFGRTYRSRLARVEALAVGPVSNDPEAGYQPYAFTIDGEVHLAVLLEDLRAALAGESDG